MKTRTEIKLSGINNLLLKNMLESWSKDLSMETVKILKTISK